VGAIVPLETEIYSDAKIVIMSISMRLPDEMMCSGICIRYKSAPIPNGLKYKQGHK